MGFADHSPSLTHSALLSFPVPLLSPLCWAHVPTWMIPSIPSLFVPCLYFTGRCSKMPIKLFNIFCYIMKIYSPPLSQIILRERINCLGDICMHIIPDLCLSSNVKGKFCTNLTKTNLKNKFHCIKIPRINFHGQELGKGPSASGFCNEIQQIIKRTNIRNNNGPKYFLLHKLC